MKRSRTQAGERKAAVAEQEANELKTKYEELEELVRDLESRNDQNSGQREREREEVRREKEQWGRMLEMEAKIRERGARERRDLEKKLETYKKGTTASDATNSTPPLTDSSSCDDLPALRRRIAALQGQVKDSAGCARRGPDITPLAWENGWRADPTG